MDAKLMPDFEIPPGVAQSLKSLSAAASGIYRVYDSKALSVAVQNAERAMARIGEATQKAYLENITELSSAISDCLRNTIKMPDLNRSMTSLLNTLETLELYRITENDSTRLQEAINAAFQATLVPLDNEPAEGADAAELLEVSEDFYDAADVVLESARNAAPDTEIPDRIHSAIQSRGYLIAKEIVCWIASIATILACVVALYACSSDAAEAKAQTALLQQIADSLQDSNDEVDIPDTFADQVPKSGNGQQQRNDAE